MLLLDNDAIQQILDMKLCLEALETGYRDLLQGDAVYRPRIDVYAPCERPDGFFRWGSMEAATRSLGVFAIRMKSDIVYWPDGKTEEKYCIRPGTYCGLIFLFSTQNGEPLAILQDGYLQHMRVGGCAGLGARYLARPDARVVGLLGSGGMARTYLMAFCQVRPITRVKVYSPTREHREAFAAEMGQRLGVSIEPVDSPEKAVRGADIVATCTDSIRPVVQDPSWIEEGMHLTNVSAREYHPEVLERCDVIVRLGRPSLMAPAQEEGLHRFFGIASYVAGQPHEVARIPRAHQETHQIYVRDYPSLTDLMSGRVAGRTDPRQVSFFINAGTQGLQFAAVGGKVYQLARERGLGREIPTQWFLQDIRD